jgi:hypothetical protein
MFDYPSTMKAWMAPLLNLNQLEVEAKEFEALGKTV